MKSRSHIRFIANLAPDLVVVRPWEACQLVHWQGTLSRF